MFDLIGKEGKEGKIGKEEGKSSLSLSASLFLPLSFSLSPCLCSFTSFLTLPVYGCSQENPYPNPSKILISQTSMGVCSMYVVCTARVL